MCVLNITDGGILYFSSVPDIGSIHRFGIELTVMETNLSRKEIDDGKTGYYNTINSPKLLKHIVRERYWGKDPYKYVKCKDEENSIYYFPQWENGLRDWYLKVNVDEKKNILSIGRNFINPWKRGYSHYAVRYMRGDINSKGRSIPLDEGKLKDILKNKPIGEIESKWVNLCINSSVE